RQRSQDRGARPAAPAPSSCLCDVAWRFAQSRHPARTRNAFAGGALTSRALPCAKCMTANAKGRRRLSSPLTSHRPSAAGPLGVCSWSLVPCRLGNWNDVVLGESGGREDDAMMDRIDLENFQLHGLAFLHRIPGLLNVGNAELRHRHKPLDITAEIDDDALVHQPHDATAQLSAHGVRLTDAEPWIFPRLFQS